jgi:predicted branched-subunit amino acid permease
LGYLNGDLNFAFFMARYPDPHGDRFALPFFLGMSLTNWCIWQTGSMLGIYLASLIPEAWGLGFAGTLALIAILLPMVDHGSAMFTAIAAAIVALLTVNLPFKLNLVLSVLTAIIVGMLMDQYNAKKPSKKGVL